MFRIYVATPSLGLGFLGSYVRQKSGCNVEIIEPFLQKLSREEVIDKVLRTEEDVFVGLVCYTESRFECFAFAKEVKKARPDATIIIGGVHADNLDELILKYYPFVDIVTRGESEETLLEIVNKKPLNEIAGITWRGGGKIIRNLERKLKENIDEYTYDYDLLEPWINEWKDFEIPVKYQKILHIPIIVSRGCKFNCTFCGALDFWRNRFRVVSSSEIVRRMKDIVEKYNVGYFRFYDALFLGNEEQRILEFCEILKKSGLKVSFRIDLRIGTTPKVLAALKEAGCIVIGFGVESASDKVLKAINKGITKRQIIETCEICRKLGYWTIGFFMISMPSEEKNDVAENFKIFKYFDELNLQFFKIHPGTPIYRDLRSRGEINDDLWFDKTKTENEYFYCKDHFPSAKLRRTTVDIMILKYYFLPTKVMQFLKIFLVHPFQIAGKVIKLIRLPLIGRLSQ